MGEVVELVTGKTLVEDTHPSDDLTGALVLDDKQDFVDHCRRAWDEAVSLLDYSSIIQAGP